MRKILAVVGIAGLIFLAPMSANAMSPSVNNLPSSETNTNTFTAPAADTPAVANVTDENIIAADVDDTSVADQAILDEIMIAANVDEDSLIFKAPNTGDYTIYLYGAAVAIFGAIVLTGKKIKN